MKIHHIGYLVENIDDAIDELLLLGYSIVEKVEKDLTRNVLIAFLNNECYTIELIQPIDNSSPFYALQKRYGNSPYHLCYKVNNLEEAIENARELGHIQMTEIQSAPVIGVNAKVVFFMSNSLGILEYLYDK